MLSLESVNFLPHDLRKSILKLVRTEGQSWLAYEIAVDKRNGVDLAHEIVVVHRDWIAGLERTSSSRELIDEWGFWLVLKSGKRINCIGNRQDALDMMSA